MSISTDRLLILGFDGCSPDLLEKWVDAGHLPVIQRLMKEGAYGPLTSVPNTISPCAWASFATGKNPGKHGIFRFTERDFSTYRYKYVNGAHRRADAFWNMLCGDRTGIVINVPMTYPAEVINGAFIAGFDAPGVESKGFCHPEGLLEEMVEKNGPYRIIRDFGNLLRKNADWSGTAEFMLDTMEMRYRHSRFLMDKYPDWELLTIVFGETDHSHHFFWKFMDPKHPDYREKEAALYGDTILDIYRRMDDIIGRYLDDYPEATVLIMSDHGGAINTRGGSMVADWLESLDLLHRVQEQDGRTAAAAVKRAINSGLKHTFNLVNRRLSTDNKFRLMRMFPGLRGKVEAAVRLGDFDWQRTRAFCDGAQDDIWINLEGRDPMGCVKPSEYDELCEFLCRELESAVDVSTGIPIVDEAIRPSRYSGDYTDRAADIAIRWKVDTVVTGIKSPSSPPGLKPVKWDWPADVPNGGHSLDGIVLAAGRDIVRGARIENAEIQDIAPTVLYQFNHEIPRDFDGRVLEAMFTPERLASSPPRVSEQTSASDQDSGEDVYSEEDNELIEQRLKDLGYL